MTGKPPTATAPPLSPGERAVFLKHMAVRLFLGLWGLYSLLSDSFSRALITLIVLVCMNGMSEIIFASLMGVARYRDRRDKEQKKRAAEEEAKQLEASQAPNYFDMA